MFDQLGLAVTQSISHKCSRVNSIYSSPELKKQIAKTFPELISRIGTSQNHVAFTKTVNLAIKNVDLFQLTYKIKSITNLRNC